MRLFFALPLPEAALDAVGEALRPLRTLSSDISWTRRGNMHLTLRFCGEVPADRVDPLADAVAPWVRRLPPPSVRLVGGGAFPDSHRPRVLWIGAEAALDGLVGAIERAVQSVGLPPEERAFTAHLTVGRVRVGRADRVLPALRELGEVARFTPDRVVLYDSQPSPEGVRYTAVRVYEV
jgi:2'-5' RNA ligase